METYEGDAEQSSTPMIAVKSQKKKKWNKKLEILLEDELLMKNQLDEFEREEIAPVNKNNAIDQVIQFPSRPQDERIMFPQSNLSIKEVEILTQALCIRFNMNYEAEMGIFGYAAKLAGPEFESYKMTRYRLSKLYDPPESTMKYIFICNKCNVVILKIGSSNFKTQEKLCPTCKEKTKLKLDSSPHFTYYNFKAIILLLLQQPNVF